MKTDESVSPEDFVLTTKGNDITFTRKYKNGKKNAVDSITFKNYDPDYNKTGNSLIVNGNYLSLQGSGFMRRGKVNGKNGAKLTGSNLNEVLVGTDKSDILKAGGGYDILYGGKGNDKLYGGKGENIFDFSMESGKDTIYLGSGVNYLYFGDVDSISNLDLIFDKKGNDLIIKEPFGDSVTIKNYFTSFYNYTEIATSLYMDGEKSYDRYYYADGGESLYDLVYDAHSEYFGPEIIDKSASKKGQKISGSLNTNVIIGTNKADTIKANLASSVNGGKGNDKLYGSEYRNNEFAFSKDHGNDTVYLGKGTILRFDNDMELSYKLKGSDLIISNLNSKGKTETVTVKNFLKNENSIYASLCIYDPIEEDDVYESLFDKLIENGLVKQKNVDYSNSKKGVTVYDTPYTDYIIGSKKADNLYSYSTGDDSIYGGAGNDKMYINACANKIIDGGSGNDTYNVNMIPYSPAKHMITNIFDESGNDSLNITYQNIGERFRGTSFYFEVNNVVQKETDEIIQIGMCPADFETGNDLYIVDTAFYSTMIANDTFDNHLPTSGVKIGNYFNTDSVDEITIKTSMGDYTSYNDKFTVNLIAQSVASWMLDKGIVNSDNVFTSNTISAQDKAEFLALFDTKQNGLIR